MDQRTATQVIDDRERAQKVENRQMAGIKRDMKRAGWRSLGGGWVQLPSGGKVHGWHRAVRPILTSIERMARGPQCACHLKSSVAGPDHRGFCPFWSAQEVR